MAGRRDNGGIIGVQNSTSQSSAKGRFSLNEVQRALKSEVWPGWSPSVLFAAGEQGTWYDPSDFSSMYQDSAGTTSVTAVEQPVGKILDKSGNGNHATQSTTTSRPILRNLYNMLTYTEQFDSAAWTKQQGAISANVETAPDGTLTADKFIPNTVAGVAHTPYVSISASNGTASIYVKAAGQNFVGIKLVGGTVTTSNCVVFDLTNLEKDEGTTGNTATITDAGDGWRRCTVTTASPITIFLIITMPDASTFYYTGDGTSGIYIWGAQLVPANEASLPYQRVVTNTLGSGVYDSDVTKFPPYLYFDGTDDFLVTGNIDFSATDKMSVFVGVRKLSDAAQGMVVEHTPNLNSYAGIGLTAPSTSVNAGATSPYASYASGISSGTGTALSDYMIKATTNTYASPISNVLAVIADRSASGLSKVDIHIDGIVPSFGTVSFTGTSVTGNFINSPLYIGSRGGTSIPFNGRIYSLITRGALTTTPLLEKTENWVAVKTGVTL